MSLLSDWKFRELGAFGGAWLNKDRSMIDTRGAILAQNVEYMTGSVGTRHGFQEITVLPQFNRVIELYEWLAPFSEINSGYADNALVVAWINSGAVRLSVQNLNTTVGGGALGYFDPPGGSMTNGGSTLLGVGMNLFCTLCDTSQRGLTSASTFRLFNSPSSPGTPLIGGVGNGAAFPGPSTYTPSITTAGAGLVTAGSHRFGYLIEYQTGFTTRVSPDAGTATIPTVFTFAPITVSAGSASTLQVAFLPNWADSRLQGITAVSIIMTTTTNLSQYYVVPGSRTLNDGVAAFTVNVSISDGDLSSTGTDATPYLYWMTRSANNVSASVPTPFTCRHIALWADRMAFMASVPDNKGNMIDAIYASERNNYQAITPDQHVLQLPGQKAMVTMFRMGSVNYILGPHEIWGVGDNGDVPVTWSAPSLVDGRHGSLAIHGAEVAPSGDRAWIADQAGLFLFTGGPILDLPLSYYQAPDWNRINWAAAYCVTIKDDSGSRRVCVTVPLDGATIASHVMTWDYTDGLTPEAVRYSLNYITLGGGALPQQPIGGMELVRNDLLNQGANFGRVELWLALWTPNTDFSTEYLLRHTSDQDALPFRDMSYGIQSVWSSCPFPGRDMGLSVVQQHHGFQARLRGLGTMTPVVWDIDGEHSFICRTVTLTETPDQDELCFADLLNELAYVSFSTKIVDTYFRVSFLRWYHTPYVMQR
jgi:hypothetical protein